MRQMLRWMFLAVFLAVFLGGAAGGAADGASPEQSPEARQQAARGVYDEAMKLRTEGRTAEALPRAEQALALLEAAYPSPHLEIARGLGLVGELLVTRNQNAQGEAMLQRALEQHAALHDETSLQLALVLNHLGAAHQGQGHYAQAEPLLQRALALREAALGGEHINVAQTLNNLALLAMDQGQYARSEAFFQRALEIAKTSDAHRAYLAQFRNNLSILYKEQGRYREAERELLSALALRKEIFGPTHPHVATTTNNLAMVYREQGQYEEAERLFQSALELWEAAFGPDHPRVSLAVNNLALIYVDQGQYAQAETYFQRALAINEKTLGKEHPQVALCLNNLANLYFRQQRPAKSEELIRRALAINEKTLGENHPDLVLTLHNLATLYNSQGQYAQARPLFERSISVLEAALGKHHPSLAESLQGLALVHLRQGAYARAEPLLLRSLTLQEAALGEHHPDLATPLTLLAQQRLARHRLSDALPLLARAFALSERRLRRESLGFSESRLDDFLKYLREDEQLLHMVLRENLADARVRRLVLGAVLLRKGRSVEETAHISRLISQRLSDEDRATFERLRALRTQLASLSLEPPDSLHPEEHPQRLEALAREGDVLEAQLAQRSAPLRALTTLPDLTEVVDRVAHALPPDAALVEFVAASDKSLFAAPLSPGAPVPSRYLALVLLPDGSTRAVDLGAAAPINAAASRLREALGRSDDSFLAPARELHQRVFAPLRPLLGSTRRVLLSPDGQLGLVPFDALHDGRRFLLDSFDFVYLSSGRQLLPPAEDVPTATSVFVLADPDFTASLSSAPPPPGSVTRTDLSSDAWVSLPGTRLEAEAIQHLLPQAHLFLGAEATKERLLGVIAPGILHLATHGFFLEAAPGESGTRAVGYCCGLSDSESKWFTRRPLLRSGLAFAGARAPAVGDASPPGTSDTALVTALEMAGLDLWGTQLVVLSACDTGRGEVSPGKGVQGLRHALDVAGAQTVVMSLWRVEDDSTQLLMDLYYRHLLEGQGRASALREAMRELRRSRPHPHDWAPFIALGSDAPLHGIVPTP